MSEAKYMNQIQLAAARAGTVLYRNNVGMAQDASGRWVKFGLATGSADLIGWTPVTITQEHVGKTLAVFTSVECKGRSTPVRPEQIKWRDAVERDGGIARIVREPEEWNL